MGAVKFQLLEFFFCQRGDESLEVLIKEFSVEGGEGGPTW